MNMKVKQIVHPHNGGRPNKIPPSVNETEDETPKKQRKVVLQPFFDVRYDRIGHFPRFTTDKFASKRSVEIYSEIFYAPGPIFLKSDSPVKVHKRKFTIMADTILVLPFSPK
ncbi:hypothetical protein TNCT_675021 [Trichonephila clavata]|uniref:Uncharacterized protein n=1 Tax=Trichonephila clavata TaxID=2740835 RepID=A0A8X6KB73_TRICU|nr:hypothetical protein TNCT_675021 [Trichonephila clavata]